MEITNNQINTNIHGTFVNNSNITGNNNIVNTNNNNTNVYIVELGKEDPSKLTLKDEQEIFKSCKGSIIKCTEKMNFNPNIPENQNMFMTNLRSDYAYKYVNGKFNVVMLESFIEEIIRCRAENVRDILTRINRFTLPDKTKERTKNKIDNLLKDIDEDDVSTMFQIKKELILTLYNYSAQVIENEKKLKEKAQQQDTLNNEAQQQEMLKQIANNPEMMAKLLQIHQDKQINTVTKPKRKYNKKPKQ